METLDEEHPVRQLYGDHDDLVAQLGRLAVLADRADAGAGTAELQPELDAAVERLRDEVGLHNRLEEDGLFPILRRRGGHPLLDTLLSEHREIRTGVADFEKGVQQWLQGAVQDQVPWVEPARRVRGKLSTHMQKENLMLFPRAMQTLTEADVADLRDAFRRMRAQPGPHGPSAAGPDASASPAPR